MDGAELRALQAPLKTRYREAPETALVPARAEAVLDFANVACAVTAGGRTVTAGLHPAAGGDGALACSADMLLAALAACAGVTLTAVASAMGLVVRAGRIIAEGTWDARGTLGVERAVPVGLTEISLTFELDTDAEPAALDRLVATTERYCVILQTLRTPPRVSVVSKRPN
ncbi:MAG TPA: OsmC family protein [Acetobacteraceae bacterium]|nr:OsmC family protein [Acetobacteraceae bacterium]